MRRLLISFCLTKGQISSFFMCFGVNVIEPVGKSDPKGDDAIFVGYAWDSVAYRVYIPRTQILVVRTNVRFDDCFQVLKISLQKNYKFKLKLPQMQQ
ncbi:hypothetical protein OSB04_002653 [Centaurea solstitialis]|uniref:Retroviral polymerase SH3-like domain-containing protein n=1 Tax=Centaurea solstitialis TaxID=347529 RepID=A0AA38WMJ3_9ASTR|nr:hypothetical protein OSB04_002653 [Centaurea solstitialis]